MAAKGLIRSFLRLVFSGGNGQGRLCAGPVRIRPGLFHGRPKREVTEAYWQEGDIPAERQVLLRKNSRASFGGRSPQLSRP
jgi:hypothetical protein